VSGLCRLSWERMHDGVFEYTASCAADGKRLTPIEAHQSGMTMKTLIVKRLKGSLGWYEWAGFCMCVFAVLVNVPWIVLLNLVTKSMVYNGE
jgi:hypothetical protein